MVSRQNAVTLVFALVTLTGIISFNHIYREKEQVRSRISHALAQQRQTKRYLQLREPELLRTILSPNGEIRLNSDADKSEEVADRSDSFEPKTRRHYQHHPRNAEKEAWLLRQLDEYIELHNNITSGRAPPRYVGCQLAHGYGNCWQLFISCVLYAMMSKRALFITREDWSRNNPFIVHIQDFLLPPPVKIYQDNVTERGVMMYGPPSDRDWPMLSWIEQASMCHDLYEDRRDDPYVLVTGPAGFDWFGDHIRENPAHRLLHRLPYNFYSIVFNYWFKLQPKYQAEVDKFKKEHFGKFTVGVQMRGWDNGGVIPVIPLNVYLQAADVIAADAPVPPEDVVFYVATLDEAQLRRFQAIYGEKKIAYYAGSREDGTDRDTDRGAAFSFIHMWLMGECDDLVTTEQSSYGCNAAARTGLIPVVCTHARFCYRRLSSQPCSYNPFPTYEMQQDCYRNESASFYRHSSVESHCGFFFRYVRDCVHYGCPNPHNSFKRDMPVWPCPKCDNGETSQ